jgi:hypothetical protein
MNTKISYEHTIKQITHRNNLALFMQVRYSTKHISEIIYGEYLPLLMAGKLLSKV